MKEARDTQSLLRLKAFTKAVKKEETIYSVFLLTSGRTFAPET